MSGEQRTREPEILLVIPDWRTRVVINAQLIEEGYQVRPLESEDEAELLLRRRAIAPRAAVLQVDRFDHPMAVVTTFVALLPDRLIALTAATGPDRAALESAGVIAVLARPFSVAQVLEAVRRVAGPPRAR